MSEQIHKFHIFKLRITQLSIITTWNLLNIIDISVKSFSSLNTNISSHFLSNKIIRWKKQTPAFCSQPFINIESSSVAREIIIHANIAYNEQLFQTKTILGISFSEHPLRNNASVPLGIILCYLISHFIHKGAANSANLNGALSRCFLYN